MDVKTLELQYAHADGHSSICYSSDGKHILTCGSDGDARIWSGNGDPHSECVGETALALHSYADHFYVGTDNNFVQAYTLPDMKRDGIVCRFTAPVTHINVNEQGTRLCASSCDMEIQVAEIDGGKDILKFVGHTAPVTGVALDPLDTYLASSSCDGTVKIWNISTCAVVKTLTNMLKSCNDFFNAVALGRPSWQSKTGGYLAIPNEKNVLLHDRDTWTCNVKLTDSRVVSSFSLVEFSPCGKRIAATSTSGDVFVWDVNNQTTIAFYCHPKSIAITGVAWHPEGKEIAVCDRFGQYSILRDVIGSVEEPDINLGSPIVEDFENDDDGNENEISLEEIKRSSAWPSPPRDDYGDDDDGGGSVTEEVRSVVRAPIQHIQPPFQPSSTPVHLQHRFMLWNAVGIVRSFDTEMEKSIDIEFHDSMFHHSIHLNNLENFTMASLSNKVVALAAPIVDDYQSKLKCLLLNAWDGSKEWSTALHDDENITAVCADDTWVAIATDSCNLRLFSYTGVQRQPISLPGPVVCMAGHGNKLSVVYHQGLGLPDCQNLGIMIYEIGSIIVRGLIAAQSLPLSPKSTLKWCGFTDEGRLCTFDSVGILRSLAFDNKHWAILSDTRLQPKGPSDHYFIIGVCERYQNIRCVLCKGAFYPSTTPRPTVVEIPLKLPLCQPEADKSELEESFWRLMSCMPVLEGLNRTTDGEWQMDVADMEKRLKQFMIKLFANACRGDIDIRATDLATMMPEQQLEMASKYASKCGKMTLADKLNGIQPINWSDSWLSLGNENVDTFRQHHHDYEENNGVLDYNSQRDMFADTPSGGERLLLVEKENELKPSSSTLGTMSPAYTNPFKLKNPSNNQPKGLSFFDKPLVTKNKIEPLRNAPIVKLKSKNKAPPTQQKKQTFVNWFSGRKTQLSEEYPELSQPELTKKAMQIFREESNVSQATPESSSNELSNGKRKCDSEEPAVTNVKKVAGEKLAGFAFQSRS